MNIHDPEGMIVDRVQGNPMSDEELSEYFNRGYELAVGDPQPYQSDSNVPMIRYIFRKKANRV